MSDVHSVARDQLRSFIERIENLESEKQAIADDIKDVKGEAKGMGYCVKTINTIIKMRKQDADERAEQEAILDTYLISLGMLPQPDLFEDEPHDAFTGELSPKLAHTIVTGMQTQTGRAALVAAVDIMIDREERNTPSDAAPASAAAVISSSNDTAKGEAGSPVGLPENSPETAEHDMLETTPRSSLEKASDVVSERTPTLVGSQMGMAVAGGSGQPEMNPALTGQFPGVNVNGLERAGVTDRRDDHPIPEPDGGAISEVKGNARLENADGVEPPPSVPAFITKTYLLRPNCQQRSNCRSGTTDHCHSCKVTMREREKEEA